MIFKNQKTLEAKYHKLLDKQIDKLDSKDFDLDAWKSSATHIISLLFGEDDPKIKEIDKLKIDYSSWALRDSSSTYKPIDSCKKVGREIMEIAKDEIDLLGVTNPKDQLTNKLKELLTDTQYEKFTEEGVASKQQEDVLKTLTKEKLVDALMSIYTP